MVGEINLLERRAIVALMIPMRVCNASGFTRIVEKSHLRVPVRCVLVDELSSALKKEPVLFAR